nr:MAG TPA: hypothetical protein [Caudoviricetes sp.]
MSYNVLKGIAEYIQELAGEDKTVVSFSMSEFMEYAGVDSKFEDEFILTALRSLQWLEDMVVLDDNDETYELIEYVDCYEDDNVTVELNRKTIESREGDKTWLSGYIDDFVITVNRMTGGAKHER